MKRGATLESRSHADLWLLMLEFVFRVGLDILKQGVRPSIEDALRDWRYGRNRWRYTTRMPV